MNQTLIERRSAYRVSARRGNGRPPKRNYPRQHGGLRQNQENPRLVMQRGTAIRRNSGLAGAPMSTRFRVESKKLSGEIAFCGFSVRLHVGRAIRELAESRLHIIGQIKGTLARPKLIRLA